MPDVKHVPPPARHEACTVSVPPHSNPVKIEVFSSSPPSRMCVPIAEMRKTNPVLLHNVGLPEEVSEVKPRIRSLQFSFWFWNWEKKKKSSWEIKNWQLPSPSAFQASRNARHGLSPCVIPPNLTTALRGAYILRLDRVTSVVQLLSSRVGI